jgi:hypothetical protein
MDKAKHAAIRLRPPLWLIEADAVDGEDVIAVDWAECREQRRDALGFARVLVSPRATRVEAQHGTGEVVW